MSICKDLKNSKLKPTFLPTFADREPTGSPPPLLRNFLQIVVVMCSFTCWFCSGFVVLSSTLPVGGRGRLLNKYKLQTERDYKDCQTHNV